MGENSADETNQRVIEGSSIQFAAFSIVAGFAAGYPQAIAQSQTDATYECDMLGRLVKTAYSSGGMREYHYDAAGHRRSVFTIVSGRSPSGPVPGAAIAEGGPLILVQINNDLYRIANLLFGF